MDQSVELNLKSNTIKNQTVEDDEHGMSLNGDYDYYEDWFLLLFQCNYICSFLFIVCNNISFTKNKMKS